ncbi:MAG: L-2-hydroxyglutarate oxidase [Bacteroidetes bacterium CG23_combo_of_CG06-09_8_20_14_all_32_9]|nr:MAG: L-2-hydroxyglutarate oxidase [Bacteroidetes bacterium CG23_combo_of_CG06-09_8_20_14_all_32_9]
MADIFQNSYHSEIRFNNKVTNIITNNSETRVITESGELTTKVVVNCCGLYSDKIAKFTIPNLDVKIIPFRGEYYTLSKEKSGMVKNLIYPVPNPAFPFLGVHFTRRIDGKVEAGPNAVFAFKREGYKKTSFNFSEAWESLTWRGFQKVMFRHLKMGLGEYYRSFNKAAFIRSLQTLVPSITIKDIVTGGAGVRAQACTRSGMLADDFLIYEKPGVINVCNAPSPAATASLAIGETIAAVAIKHL